MFPAPSARRTCPKTVFSPSLFAEVFCPCGVKRGRGAKPRDPGFKRGSDHHRHCVGMENKVGFSRVSSPPVTTPLVAGVAPYTVGPLAITPPCYHSICDLAVQNEASRRIPRDSGAISVRRSGNEECLRRSLSYGPTGHSSIFHLDYLSSQS